MAQFIYFFILAIALGFASPTLHADDTEMSDMGEEVDAAQGEVQEAVDEAQQEGVEEEEAADEVEAAEDMGVGQEGPEDAVQAADEASENLSY